MIASLALAALLSSASPGTFANCIVQLDTTTVQQQFFTNFSDAKSICEALRVYRLALEDV